jgi:hypothetical protein
LKVANGPDFRLTPSPTGDPGPLSTLASRSHVVSLLSGPSFRSLVQHGHQDHYPYLSQEVSPPRSRANGEADGKVSFRDGLMGGMEKEDDVGTRHENARPGESGTQLFAIVPHSSDDMHSFTYLRISARMI